MPQNSREDPATPPHLRPPAMDHDIGGSKSSQYSDRMASIILARIQAGETMGQVVADAAMPSYRTLYDWIRQNPGFGEAVLKIRRDQAAAHRARLDAQNRARAERRRTTPRARSGRKSTYSPARAKAVCALIADGFTTRQIGRLPGLPSVSTIHFWLRRHPDFRPLYADACHQRAQMLDFELWFLTEGTGPSSFAAVKREAAVIEKRIADCAPMVWWG